MPQTLVIPDPAAARVAFCDHDRAFRRLIEEGHGERLLAASASAGD